VLIPDDTKTIVQRADPLESLLNPTCLEYAQSRGFVIDPLGNETFAAASAEGAAMTREQAVEYALSTPA
jgi:hypothetical protein